ncbi:hypothetical protein ACFCV3_00935 [Kribbella sp. NPDC056345]|uniref:hypothetical protein n=1 Tax=Kribbella sp. NPDC056345 TaxID=3345789 RepID=UPI0035E2A32E
MDQSNKVPRTAEDDDWEVVVSADNGIDLLQYIFRVENFTAAASAGSEIAVLISQHEEAEEVKYTQVTLQAWQVEIRVSAPTGCWYSPSQQAFTKDIRNRFNQHRR